MGTLASIAAVAMILPSLVITIGLTERGQSGRPVFSLLGAVLLVSTIGTALAVFALVRGASDALFAVTAVPPATIVTLLLLDPDAMWGNFPPSPPRRVLVRAGAVLAFALPGLLALLARA